MIEILRTRRSIRKYRKRPIEPSAIEVLEESLLRSPSSRGINPWRFIIVDDPGLLARLSEAKEHGAAFLKDAALGIVICADERESDVWIEDCSIASLVVHLSAHSLGLGSCWIQVRNRFHASGRTAEEYIREILAIPPNVRVLSMISIGHPAETRQPVPAARLERKKIMRNGYTAE